MADVAAAAGVSPMTVSYAFSRPERVSPPVRETVLEAARTLDYHGPNRVARSLARNRTDSIAVVVHEGLSYALGDPESVKFLAGVHDVCAEHNQSIILIAAHTVERDLRRVRSAAVDGYILWTGVVAGPLMDAMLATGRPVAIQGTPPKGVTAKAKGRLGVVTIDDRAAAAAVAEVTLRTAKAPLVLSFGLTTGARAEIVHGPPLSRVELPVTRARLEGIKATCRRLGIAWSSVTVAAVPRNRRGEARELMDEVLASRTPVDAVVAMSDQLALAALESIEDHGLTVPGDVTVSGWDDSPEAARHNLTSVAQSLEDQGGRCVRIILGEPENDEPPGWHLVERHSTKRI